MEISITPKPDSSITIIRRRPHRPKGGRPPKPPAHKCSHVVHGRLTNAEMAALKLVMERRATSGLPGSKCASEWIRAMIEEDARKLGIESTSEYDAVRAVRMFD